VKKIKNLFDETYLPLIQVQTKDICPTFQYGGHHEAPIFLM